MCLYESLCGRSVADEVVDGERRARFDHNATSEIGDSVNVDDPILAWLVAGRERGDRLDDPEFFDGFGRECRLDLLERNRDGLRCLTVEGLL